MAPVEPDLSKREVHGQPDGRQITASKDDQRSVIPSRITDDQRPVIPSRITDDQRSVIPSRTTDDQRSVIPSRMTDDQRSVIPSRTTDDQRSLIPCRITDDQRSVIPNRMTDDQRSIYTNQHAEDQRSINTSHQTDDQRWANSSQLRDQSIPEYDQRGISQLTDPKSTSSSKKNVFDFNRQTQNRALSPKDMEQYGQVTQKFDHPLNQVPDRSTGNQHVNRQEVPDPTKNLDNAQQSHDRMGDSYEHSTDGRDVGGHGTSRQEAPGVTRQPDNSENRMATYREKEVPNVSRGPNVQESNNRVADRRGDVRHDQAYRQEVQQGYPINQNSYRQEPVQSDDVEDVPGYTAGKVSKTFVKEDMERRQQQSARYENGEDRYQKPISNRNNPENLLDKPKDRRFPRQESDDSNMPTTPSSDSDRHKPVTYQNSQEMSDPRSTGVKNNKADNSNSHQSSFPAQSRQSRVDGQRQSPDGKPVLHFRKTQNQQRNCDSQKQSVRCVIFDTFRSEY
jgi:hypothetical protein